MTDVSRQRAVQEGLLSLCCCARIRQRNSRSVILAARWCSRLTPSVKIFEVTFKFPTAVFILTLNKQGGFTLPDKQEGAPRRNDHMIWSLSLLCGISPSTHTDLTSLHAFLPGRSMLRSALALSLLLASASAFAPAGLPLGRYAPSRRYAGPVMAGEAAVADLAADRMIVRRVAMEKEGELQEVRGVRGAATRGQMRGAGGRAMRMLGEFAEWTYLRRGSSNPTP